jgi:hypothetical protein
VAFASTVTGSLDLGTTDGFANQFSAIGNGTGSSEFGTLLVSNGNTHGTLSTGSMFQQRTIATQLDVNPAVGKAVTFATNFSSYIRLGFGSNHSIPPYAVGDIAKAAVVSAHVANESLITAMGTATAMANNGLGAIRVTIPSTTGLATGQEVHITGTVGTTEANGFWLITLVNGTQFDLDSSTFSNAWVSGGAVTTGGTITQGIAFSAEDFDFEEGTTPPTTGIFRETAGLKVGDIGHATRVIDSASGVHVIDQTGGATHTAAVWSEMTSGTGKYFLLSTGNAPSSHYGALRVGFVGTPGVPVFDGEYQPTTLPSGTTQASQFYSEFSDAAASGSPALTNVVFRINSTAGTHAIATLRPIQAENDIANTSGTITTINGIQAVTTISGTPNITALRHFNSSLAFSGASGTTTEASNFYVQDINSSGAHAITTTKGLYIGDIGHATHVTNAYGVDISDITASVTSTVGIRSAMNTATGKYFISHTGTAPSAFGGNVSFTAGTFQFLGNAGGVADALTLTPTPAVTSLTTGAMFIFKATADNATTTPTLAISGQSARTMVKRASTALAASDLVNGGYYMAVIQATTIQILNPTVP